MKKNILLPLLSLPLSAAPEIEFNALRIEYPAPPALQDQGSAIHPPLTLRLSVQGIPISRESQQEIYMEDLRVTDSRGNDLQPHFDSENAYDNEYDIIAKQYPQGTSIYLSGTAHLYLWEKTTTLPPLQPDWKNGCTLTQNGMQIRCSADKPGHLYLNEQFIPTPSYRVEITVPQDNLSPVQEVTPLREDGTPFKDGEYVVDSDAKHGTYCFRLISATPPTRIQLTVAAAPKRHRIPFRMRVGMPGRLNLPTPR